jgi:hypothetical protein
VTNRPAPPAAPATPPDQTVSRPMPSPHTPGTNPVQIAPPSWPTSTNVDQRSRRPPAVPTIEAGNVPRDHQLGQTRPAPFPAPADGSVPVVADLESVRKFCITRLGMTSMRCGQSRAAVSALVAAHCELDALVLAHAVPLCRMCAKRPPASVPEATFAQLETPEETLPTPPSQGVVLPNTLLNRFSRRRLRRRASHPRRTSPGRPGRTTTLRAAWRRPRPELHLASLGALVLSDQVRQLTGVRTAGPSCRLDL